MAEKKKSFMEFIENNKKILGWLTAILVLITTFISTYDKLKDFFSSDPTLEYRQIILDSSANMSSEFIPGKSKWDAAKEAVGKMSYDPRIESIALRQFGGNCETVETDLKLSFGDHGKEKIQSVLDETQLLGGEVTLIQALWNAIGDFVEQNRLSAKSQVFNTITVIAGSGEACNPDDVTRLKNRLDALDIELEFQIIPMGLDESEMEKLTKLSNALSPSVKIIEADDQADLDRALQNPDLANLFSQGRSYWRAGNDEEAIPILEEAADKGLAEAMILLGDIHADITKQEHTDDDDETAVEWYRKGADAGNAAAMTRLGIMYKDSRGVGDNSKKNLENAKKWFTKASELGNEEAQKYLNQLQMADK